MVELMRAVSLVAAVMALALTVAACGGGDSQSAAPPTGRIAFTSNRDGNQEVYLMSADGGDQINLTNDAGGDTGPWWSPDGERIAFVSERDGFLDIYIMNADGSELQQLTNSPAEDGGVRFSPDGRQIAFYSFQDQIKGFLWVMNLDSSEPTAVLEEIHPSSAEVECAGGFPGGWFPDGKRILLRGYHGDSNALQICSVNVDGTGIKVIFSEPNIMSFFPAISPDGKKIAFATNRDENTEIYVIDAGGGNLRRVTNDDGADTTPAWSSDGQWIAFASDRDGDFEIYIVRADGSGLRQLTNNTAGDGQPAWSPR